MAKVTIEDARRAKPKAGRAARMAGPVTGVGLTKIGESYAVKVNFAQTPQAGAALPTTVDGVPVVYEVIGRITRRAR